MGKMVPPPKRNGVPGEWGIPQNGGPEKRATKNRNVQPSFSLLEDWAGGTWKLHIASAGNLNTPIFAQLFDL